MVRAVPRRGPPRPLTAAPGPSRGPGGGTGPEGAAVAPLGARLRWGHRARSPGATLPPPPGATGATTAAHDRDPPTLALVLSLALTACSPGADDATAAEPAPEDAPASAGTAGFTEPEDPYAVTDPELGERLHLPLYDYVLDEHEQWTVRRAQDLLAVECLVGLGYDVAVDPDTPTSEGTLTHFGPYHEYRRYGVARVDLAGEHGFAVPEDDFGDPYVLGEGVDEEAVYSALRGDPPVDSTSSGEPVPEGGCSHQANLRLNPESPGPGGGGMWATQENGLMPDTPGTHHLAEDLAGTAYSTALGDPAAAAAAEAWKECAGLAGYSVDPAGASEVTDDAVLSAECLDSSGYLDAAVAAETRAQEPLVEEHRDALEERRDRLAEELAAAREVLGW